MTVVTIRRTQLDISVISDVEALLNLSRQNVHACTMLLGNNMIDGSFSSLLSQNVNLLNPRIEQMSLSSLDPFPAECSSLGLDQSVFYIISFRKLDLGGLFLGNLDAVGIVLLTSMGSITALSVYCPPLRDTKYDTQCDLINCVDGVDHILFSGDFNAFNSFQFI